VKELKEKERALVVTINDMQKQLRERGICYKMESIDK